jgi:hypothetical protein
MKPHSRNAVGRRKSRIVVVSVERVEAGNTVVTVV